MPQDRNEPQSYGSGTEWVEGDVGQTVNRQKGKPNSQHADFYESRRDGEGSAPHQGGHVSEQQAAESVRPSPPTGGATGGGEDVAEPPKVRTEEGGARRESYFKKRDY
ncbi:MAG TPA: hypothetical protein VGR02_07045 [Thermoanaerobaculia bacterium]|jgi:hypothetical protein|nr:hypothetical protein [Thermoanaerobaculia bacterium]